jgi:dipeptidyl aminopeptidase/acylaminoacyl peptidase
MSSDADAGFIVVAPHYRGSNGWKGRDEMGALISMIW